MFIVGIDLGTTNTCCYYEHDGKVVHLTDEAGKILFPSCVDFRKDGSTKCGSIAKYNSVANTSSSVVMNSKRIIGKQFKCTEVDQMKHYCGLPIVDVNGSPHFKITTPSRTVSPKEVAAYLIRHILDRVEKVAQKKVTNICITIPAHFGNQERVDTLEAVKMAAEKEGLTEDDILIQNEPTAAAICYKYDRTINNGKILVYDFGGGTFDVSILEIFNEGIEIKRYGGNPHLGGCDIDMIIVDWVKEVYEELYNTPLLPDTLPEKVRRRHERRMLQIAEECKIQLQSLDAVQFTMPFVSQTKPATVDDENEFSIDLTRNEFNRRIAGKIQETIDVVKEVLEGKTKGGQGGQKSQRYTVDDIDHVVLVGGSSRIGLVHTELEKMFGEAKLHESVNPDQCVAKGACLNLVHKERITEIIATSLGKTIVNNRVMCVIPRQSALPAEGSVTTYTVRDNQDEVESFVVQGYQDKNDEISPYSDNDFKKLAPYSFTGFEKKPAGEVEFNTTFRMEVDGIVYVTVKEANTGKILLDHQRIQYKH